MLPNDLFAFLQVILIDLTLAGDNAIVVGMAAAGLAPAKRRKAIVIGILAATVLRILFALFATQLLGILGLTLAGGLLLLWVAWKLYQQIKAPDPDTAGTISSGGDATAQPPQTLRNALIQIVIADVSMSLDNVLAVAGAARENLPVLVVGLALSVILMGAAATLISRLLQRHRWIAYVGLLVIVYVALKMIWDGGIEVAHAMA